MRSIPDNRYNGGTCRDCGTALTLEQRYWLGRCELCEPSLIIIGKETTMPKVAAPPANAQEALSRAYSAVQRLPNTTNIEKLVSAAKAYQAEFLAAFQGAQK